MLLDLIDEESYNIYMCVCMCEIKMKSHNISIEGLFAPRSTINSYTVLTLYKLILEKKLICIIIT